MADTVSDNIIAIGEQLKHVGRRLPRDLSVRLAVAYTNILQTHDLSAMADFASLKSPDLALSLVGDIVTLELLCISRLQRSSRSPYSHHGDVFEPAKNTFSIAKPPAGDHILNQALIDNPNIDPLDRLFCSLLAEHLPKLSLPNLTLAVGSRCLNDGRLHDAVRDTLIERINNAEDVLTVFSVAVDGCYEIIENALDIRHIGFDGLLADSLPDTLMALMPKLFAYGGDLNATVTMAPNSIDAGSALWCVPMIYNLKSQDAQLFLDALINYGYDINTLIDGRKAIDMIRRHDGSLVNHLLHTAMRHEARQSVDSVPKKPHKQDCPAASFKI